MRDAKDGSCPPLTEATGDYWKPFYLPQNAGFELMLVKAWRVKNLPGRKSGVSNPRSWLNLPHGLIRGSFVHRHPSESSGT